MKPSQDTESRLHLVVRLLGSVTPALLRSVISQVSLSSTRLVGVLLTVWRAASSTRTLEQDKDRDNMGLDKVLQLQSFKEFSQLFLFQLDQHEVSMVEVQSTSQQKAKKATERDMGEVIELHEVRQGVS